MFKQLIKHYLPFISKPNLARVPLIHSGYKALQKDQALATCIKSLLSKNAIERVENVKSLGFYSHLFLVPQASPKVEASNRRKQAQHLSACRRFKMETPESIRASLIPGEWVSSIDLSDAYHPHSPKFKDVPRVLSQVSGVPIHLSSLRPSHGSTGLYNDCKGGEADGPDKGNQASPIR